MGLLEKGSGVARRGEIRRMTSVHVEEEEEEEVVQQQDNFIKKSVYAVGGAPLSPRVRPLQIAYFSALSERLPVITLQKAYKSSLFRETTIPTIHNDYKTSTIAIAYCTRGALGAGGVPKKLVESG